MLFIIYGLILNCRYFIIFLYLSICYFYIVEKNNIHIKEKLWENINKKKL